MTGQRMPHSTCVILSQCGRNGRLGAGIYYLSKEKHDPESKKIYTVVSVIGGAVAIVCAVLLAVA